MVTPEEEKKNVSRRSFLGAGLLLPFLSSVQPLAAKNKTEDESEYTTMLTSSGKLVKVRKSALSKAKVIERNMSNHSLLRWLKLK